MGMIYIFIHFKEPAHEESFVELVLYVYESQKKTAHMSHLFLNWTKLVIYVIFPSVTTQ